MRLPPYKQETQKAGVGREAREDTFASRRPSTMFSCTRPGWEWGDGMILPHASPFSSRGSHLQHVRLRGACALPHKTRGHLRCKKKGSCLCFSLPPSLSRPLFLPLSPSLALTRGSNHVGCADPRSVTTVTNGISLLKYVRPGADPGSQVMIIVPNEQSSVRWADRGDRQRNELGGEEKTCG